MKTLTLVFALAIGLATVALTAGPAPAQDDPPPADRPACRPHRPIPPELREKILNAFDKNGDGTLDEQERNAAREAAKERLEKGHQAILDRYDADKDGRLSPDERQAAIQDAKAIHEQLRGQFGADGDSRLSPEDRRAALASLTAEQRRLLQTVHRWKCIRDRIDADNDGRISDAEREAARERFKQGRSDGAPPGRPFRFRGHRHGQGVPGVEP